MGAALTTFELPQPRLRHVYRLEAQLEPPVDVGLTPLGGPDEFERLPHGEEMAPSQYTFSHDREDRSLGLIFRMDGQLRVHRRRRAPDEWHGL